MNKFFNLVALLLCSVVWNAASAQTYVKGNPYLSYDAATEGTLSANCIWTGDEANWGCHNLVDGDLNTCFHSSLDWTPTTHWLQVNFGSPIERFYFSMNNRHIDMTSVTLFHLWGSNDGENFEDLGIEVEGAQDNEASSLYESPLIELDGAWQYLRFVVAAHYTANTWWNIGEFQVYEAVSVDNPAALLEVLVDSISNLQLEFSAGTGVGEFPQQKIDDFEDALLAGAAAQPGQSAAYYDDLANKLRTAFYDLLNSMVGVETGYYFILNKFDEFVDEEAMSANKKNATWGLFDATNPAYLWKIEKADDGTFTIYNVKAERYLSNTAAGAGQGTLLPVSEDADVAQTIEFIGWGQFHIGNVDNRQSYHALDHRNGTAGDVCIAQKNSFGVGTASAWAFVAVDDATAEALIARAELLNKAEALEAVLPAAQTAIITAKGAQTPLITDASQLSSNSIIGAGNGPEAAIDGNPGTHYHSATGLDFTNADYYIQIDLRRDDVTELVVEYTGRGDGTPAQKWHDTPNHFVLVGTNDLGSDNWTQIADIEDPTLKDENDQYFKSDVIKVETPFRYIRFIVRSVTSGNGYWNVCQFQLYTTVVDANAPYYKQTGMAELVDELEKKVNEAEKAIQNLTAEEEQVEAIQELTAQVNALLAINDDTRAALVEAQDVYNEVTDGSVIVDITKGLITDALSQAKSNCTWEIRDGDNYVVTEAQKALCDAENWLGALFDNSYDTYWHSNPSSATNVGNFFVRNQNEFIQLDLVRTDVQKLVLTVTRRHDTYQGTVRTQPMPSRLVIMGTNDDALAANIDMEPYNTSGWEQIYTLSNIPAGKGNDSYNWPYVSPVITPAMPYRYIRVYCTAAEEGLEYWAISDMQIYDANTLASNKQYEYVTGMKDAADQLKAKIDELKDKMTNYSVTPEDLETLAELKAAVEALIVDYTPLTEKVAEAKYLKQVTVVGNDFGELSDAKYLDELQEAIDNAPTLVPSNEALAEAIAALQTAINNVWNHVASIDPTKWYYILNACTPGEISPGDGYYGIAREVNGGALYILGENKGNNEGVYNTGNQLRWGMDNIKDYEGFTGTYVGDPDAMWRFLPVEGDEANVYYVQNLRTGFFIGQSVGAANVADPYYRGDAAPVSYRLEFLGGGQIGIVAKDNAKHPGAIRASDNARQIWGAGGTPQPNSRTAWTLEEAFTQEDIEAGLAAFEIRYDNNDIRIVTLPYAVKDLEFWNEEYGVKTYTLQSIADDGETIYLAEKNEFAAGEPFIMTVGTYEFADSAAYADADHTKVKLLFPAPETKDFIDGDVREHTDTVNGLAGTMVNKRIYPNNAYIIDGKAKAVLAEAGVVIAAQKGFIIPQEVQTTGDEPAIDLGSSNGPLAVKSALKSIDLEKVNIYTIDGKLLRKAVKPSEATKGLSKGIYVVGKKKVAVK